MTKKNKGKLIVIDGADGSGKATQTALLAKRLKKEGYPVKTIDFPRYDDNLFGTLIGDCLAGRYGDFIALDAHIASALYAADRYESKKIIVKWLEKGYIVIADRYVSANQIHQGGKIADPVKRKTFLRWLDDMEFGVFGLPRPEAILYLDVPREVSDRLLAERENLRGKGRVRRKKDLAESDRKHLDDARVSALKILKRKNNWIRIQCVRKGDLRSRESIAEEILMRVKEAI